MLCCVTPVHPMNDHEGKIAVLRQHCQEAKNNAYCPYSKFRVGAAVLTDKGNIYTGSNVENCSYGLTLCAETVAAAKAVSCGDRNFVAVAVSADTDPANVTFPCGRCRQFLAEFSLGDMDVIMVSKDNSTCEKKLSQLLPDAFTPKALFSVTPQIITKEKDQNQSKV